MADRLAEIADVDLASATFALRLRHSRLRAGLSQQQLADFSTLSVRAIRDIENGRVARPRQDTCALLMKVLNDDTLLPAPVVPQRGRGASRRAHVADPISEQLSDRYLARNSWADGPFLDRADELEVLANLYDSEHHRLVTVTGLEGVGKTRLAVEFARQSRTRGAQAVLWLPAHERPRARGETKGNAARLAATARELVAAGQVGVQRLRHAIAGRRSLIVFDGDWRAGELADIVGGLLDGCARLRIMVTSRWPTGLPTESVLPLAPLAVPDVPPDPVSTGDLAEVGRFPGVQMFLTHVAPLRPSFRLNERSAAAVVRICRALDGIPAALECAARWSQLYAPEQLAQLLVMDPLLVAEPPNVDETGARNLFASLRGTIAGLTERQRRLLNVWSERAARWTVPEAAAAAGITVGNCTDDVIRLLSLGLVRRRDDGDRVAFETLNVIRSLYARHPW